MASQLYKCTAFKEGFTAYLVTSDDTEDNDEKPLNLGPNKRKYNNMHIVSRCQ